MLYRGVSWGVGSLLGSKNRVFQGTKIGHMGGLALNVYPCGGFTHLGAAWRAEMRFKGSRTKSWNSNLATIAPLRPPRPAKSQKNVFFSVFQGTKIGHIWLHAKVAQRNFLQKWLPVKIPPIPPPLNPIGPLYTKKSGPEYRKTSKKAYTKFRHTFCTKCRA